LAFFVHGYEGEKFLSQSAGARTALAIDMDSSASFQLRLLESGGALLRCRLLSWQASVIYR